MTQHSRTRFTFAATAGLFLVVAGIGLVSTSQSTSAQASGRVRIQATTNADLREWDAFVTSAERARTLRTRSSERDPMMPGRVVERLEQYSRGVRVWGAEVVRDSSQGVASSIFGDFVTSADAVDTTPALSQADAVRAFDAIGSRGSAVAPELVLLPQGDASPRLAYYSVVRTSQGPFQIFLDAHTGAELMRITEWHTQAAVGTGRGVHGDVKKISTRPLGGTFVTDDQLRPPFLLTYDMRGNLLRTLNVLDGITPLTAGDLASDTDNDWNAPAQVDAHVYVGWTYDYFFKRFGRRGLDDRDRPIVVITNAVSQEAWRSVPNELLGLVFNAFWCPSCGPNFVGVMYFGNGQPPGTTVDGITNYGYFSGSLEVVAHELTHGVTSSTSRLINQGESGALNEAFSDIMGTGVEFYFQSPGTGPGQADYLLGEDVARRSNGLHGIRSMQTPGLFGDPDHYSRRYRGSEDNGGIHINSGIVNHAFYLAVEGGTNITSGLAVQGVGAANREMMEKVFYRAFVFLLPANATFSTARAATIQASRDLYGSGSAAERAITQAWTAVGVN